MSGCIYCIPPCNNAFPANKGGLQCQPPGLHTLHTLHTILPVIPQHSRSLPSYPPYPMLLLIPSHDSLIHSTLHTFCFHSHFLAEPCTFILFNYVSSVVSLFLLSIYPYPFSLTRNSSSSFLLSLFRLIPLPLLSQIPLSPLSLFLVLLPSEHFLLIPLPLLFLTIFLVPSFCHFLFPSLSHFLFDCYPYWFSVVISLIEIFVLDYLISLLLHLVLISKLLFSINSFVFSYTYFFTFLFHNTFSFSQPTQSLPYL